MRRGDVAELLARVARGELTVDEATNVLAELPFRAGAEVVADTHRALRTGHGEAVYCAGKTPEQAATAFAALAAGGGPVIATRADEAHARAILAVVSGVIHHSTARMVVLAGPTEPAGTVAVVCAGTSDLAVAEEAAVTASALGATVSRLSDVGVAGLHRLLAHLEPLRRADVIIAVAGMEGALPSVLAGLVEAPVVAVPTSVGYGAAFGGLAPLLAMLNACAAGVGVVNIDNGFGAAVLALRMLRRLRGERAQG
jgi:hypothetical protein